MEENESTSASALRHPDLRDLMRRFIEVRRALNCALKSLEHSDVSDFLCSRRFAFNSRD